MIARLAIVAAGILLAVVTVVLWKKLPAAWRAGLLAGAILVAGIGGAFTYGSWQQQRTDQEYVYLSLRYLQNSDTSTASYYLKKVGTDTFQSMCTEALLETMRSNDVLARMKLDGANTMVKDSSQEAITVKLGALGTDTQASQDMVQTLLDTVNLSESDTQKLDARFVSESGYYLEGVDMTVEDTDAGAMEESIRQTVSRDLGNANYGSAVQSAVSLVENNASAKNRLLLAEAVAEATYGGYVFNGAEFADYNTEEAPEEDTERKELSEQLDAISGQVDDLDTLLQGETEEGKIAELTEQKEELTTQQQKLQNQYDYIYAHRAFNSIADIYSLDAAIVRARLYFAMNDYAKAVDVLQQASTSLPARLTPNASLRNALNVLNTSYTEGDTLGAQSEEFRSAINTVLTSGAMDYAGISVTPLTESFTNYIISELRNYGRDLYATDIDLSNYPDVVVSLSGRDTLVEKIVSGSQLIVRDTHQDVSYTIEAVEAESTQRNVICIVDESGSMTGTPLRDAQTALRGFISSLDDDLNMALVSFDDGARILTEMGDDKSSQLAAVDLLGNGGGTNITAGIQAGLDVANGKEGSTTVLLMTDGQSSIDMNVVQEAADRGMIIHTIGFGSVDDNLLQQIADTTGGQYIRADSSSELTSVYLSLVGMIGNQFRVHYTAPDLPEEDQRYFFLREEEENVSVRVNYSFPEEEGPNLTGVSRSRFTMNELTYAQESGQSLNLVLFGTGLQNVTGVTVGGQTAQINEDSRMDTSLNVEFSPQLTAGWQTIVLTSDDGTTKNFEHMLVVGEVLPGYNYQFGRLHIRASATLLNDGTLVLTDGYLDDSTAEANTAGTSVTLSMNFSGTLFTQVDYDSFQALLATLSYDDVVVLDPSIPLQGGGSASLNYNDSGYDDSVSNMVVAGSYLLQSDGDQVKLIQQ